MEDMVIKRRMSKGVEGRDVGEKKRD